MNGRSESSRERGPLARSGAWLPGSRPSVTALSEAERIAAMRESGRGASCERPAGKPAGGQSSSAASIASSRKSQYMSM